MWEEWVMKKYTADELAEALDIYMGLCEEFPELYDKYVEKVENELKNYKAEPEVTEENKKLAMEKIWSRIKSEDWQ